MLLTLTSTHRPATDLGYLLVKHPDRLHSKELAFGTGHVFFPEAAQDRCTAALMLEVDPIGLVRRDGGQRDFQLRQYVNDRPYVASSFLSVAIARLLGSALGGRSKDRPELAATPIPLEARLEALPCRGGEEVLKQLFEPLGYAVDCRRLPLDPRFPEWGESPYFSLTLTAEVRLADLLGHLYVLMPVLDDDKHYWVGQAEVDKLLRHAGDWLAGHPAKELITRRYLRYQGSLTRSALARLSDGEPDPDRENRAGEREEARLEKPLRLHDLRLERVHSVLRELNCRRVLDLGCGGGQLLRRLLRDRFFDQIVGLDVSTRALEDAERRLGVERLPERQRQRLRLLHGSLTYRDDRLAGFDGAAVVEVIEHLDPGRLSAFERVLFAHARPGVVVLTTPNAEYNVLFDGLGAGRFRHRDHRFEWTRVQFRQWAEGVAERHGYGVQVLPLGEEHDDHGAPSQMGVFRCA